MWFPILKDRIFRGLLQIFWKFYHVFDAFSRKKEKEGSILTSLWYSWWRMMLGGVFVFFRDNHWSRRSYHKSRWANRLLFSAESALRETYDAVSYPVPFAWDSDIGGEHWWARAWDVWIHENGARGPFRANHINNSREEAHRGSALPNSFCCEIAYDDDSRDRQP